MSLLAAEVMTGVPHNRMSLWRGAVMCLASIGMAIHAFWFYWVGEPFKVTPCGTWIFPFGRTESLTLRHGAYLIYAIISAVVCASWSILAVLAFILFVPDLITVLESLRPAKGRPHEQTRSSFFRLYHQNVERVAAPVKEKFLETRLRTALSDKQRK